MNEVRLQPGDIDVAQPRDAGIDQPDDADVATQPTLLSARLRAPLMVGAVLLTLLGVLLVYLLGGRYMSTDDAYVTVARTAIGSNVAGQVAMIAVKDNQRVQRGELLFKIDDAPFRIAVEEARAQLGTARLQVEAGKAAYRRAVAAQRSAQDTLTYRQQELDRERTLRTAGIASQAQLNQAQNEFDTARQALVSAQQQAASVLAALGGDLDAPPQQHPAVQNAQASLDRALLNLSYTSILAPADGIVTQVERLQVGGHIAAAAPVFALMSTHDVWVEANFKEDQLNYMRAGQLATVAVDAYPGHRFDGVVGSIAPGTGSEFSALPAQNATGNWVKVTQRVPVRVELKDSADSLVLASGLSATVEVDTGHRRSLFGVQAAP